MLIQVQPMSGDELRQALLGLHVPQTEFADYIGVDRRTVRRWIAGEVPVPALAVIAVLHLQSTLLPS